MTEKGLKAIGEGILPIAGVSLEYNPKYDSYHVVGVTIMDGYQIHPRLIADYINELNGSLKKPYDAGE